MSKKKSLTMPATPPRFRDRIKELRRVRASELLSDEKNWRTHDAEQQNAMRGILAEIGWIDGVLARELPDGSLKIINGHLRKGISGDDLVPVLITDLNEEESAKALLTFDPIATMAGKNLEALDALVKEVDIGDEAIQLMMGQLAAESDLYLQHQAEAEQSVEEAWQGMPEFNQEDLTAWKTLKVHFRNEDDLKAFAKLVKQKMNPKTPSIWYPIAEKGVFADKRWDDESKVSGLHHQ